MQQDKKLMKQEQKRLKQETKLLKQEEQQAKKSQKIQKEQLLLQRKQSKLEAKQYKKMAKCPKCKSTSLSAHKKGYGIGKGVIGASVVGGLGLVAGNINARKVKVTSMNCGKRFKP